MNSESDTFQLLGSIKFSLKFVSKRNKSQTYFWFRLTHINVIFGQCQHHLKLYITDTGTRKKYQSKLWRRKYCFFLVELSILMAYPSYMSVVLQFIEFKVTWWSSWAALTLFHREVWFRSVRQKGEHTFNSKSWEGSVNGEGWGSLHVLVLVHHVVVVLQHGRDGLLLFFRNLKTKLELRHFSFLRKDKDTILWWKCSLTSQ